MYNQFYGKKRHRGWENEKDPLTQNQKKTCDQTRNARLTQTAAQIKICYDFDMRRKIIISLGVIVSLVIVAFLLSQNQPPPLLTTNFVNLDKIERVSRYRSCAGHVTVPQDNREKQRNMKHYFWVKKSITPIDEPVEIYAPYDGFISVLRSDPAEKLEGEVALVPQDAFVFLPPVGRWTFSVQHINVRPGLNRGDKVKAGELLGTATVRDDGGGSFDIVYAKFGLRTKTIDNWTAPFTNLDSVFNHMTDAVFAQYTQKGAVSRKDFIITKELRDTNLCNYEGQGPYFSNQEEPENWVFLK